MTTSYELSLRLKELGAPQERGEYYWCEYTFTKKIILSRTEPRGLSFSVICRAFTLGELVRELAVLGDVTLDVYKAEASETMTYAKLNGRARAAIKDSPEEAAGELLAEILKQIKTDEKI